MCNCSSFRENCVIHARMHARTDARTHTHGANYNLPPASRAGDKNAALEEEVKVKHTVWKFMH